MGHCSFASKLAAEVVTVLNEALKRNGVMCVEQQKISVVTMQKSNTDIRVEKNAREHEGTGLTSYADSLSGQLSPDSERRNTSKSQIERHWHPPENSNMCHKATRWVREYI